MHCAHDFSRFISANRDQTQVEWSTVLANLLESGTMRQSLDFRVIVIELSMFCIWDSTVAGVASEVDILAARLNTPTGPECLTLVERCSCRDVLVGETRYCC